MGMRVLLIRFLGILEFVVVRVQVGSCSRRRRRGKHIQEPSSRVGQAGGWLAGWLGQNELEFTDIGPTEKIGPYLSSSPQEYPDGSAPPSGFEG